MSVPTDTLVVPPCVAADEEPPLPAAAAPAPIATAPAPPCVGAAAAAAAAASNSACSSGDTPAAFPAAAAAAASLARVVAVALASAAPVRTNPVMGSTGRGLIVTLLFPVPKMPAPAFVMTLLIPVCGSRMICPSPVTAEPIAPMGLPMEIGAGVPFLIISAMSSSIFLSSSAFTLASYSALSRASNAGVPTTFGSSGTIISMFVLPMEGGNGGTNPRIRSTSAASSSRRAFSARRSARSSAVSGTLTGSSLTMLSPLVVVVPRLETLPLPPPAPEVYWSKVLSIRFNALNPSPNRSSLLESPEELSPATLFVGTLKASITRGSSFPASRNFFRRSSSARRASSSAASLASLARRSSSGSSSVPSYIPKEYAMSGSHALDNDKA